MRPLGILALLLSTSLLAGCAGKAPAASELAGEPGEPGQALAGATPFTTLSYVGTEEVVHEVVWANGTVNAQDTCSLGACVLDNARALHATDLTGLVPQGVPTLVSYVLDWNAGPVSFGGWAIGLEAPESTIYTESDAGQPGHVEGLAVVRPSGPVSVVLAAYGPGGDLPATPYTLRITVDAHPQALFPGVPVALPLEPGDTVRAGSYGGGEAEFLLYGPDDSRLGLFSGEHTLPAGAPAGEYVLMLPLGGPTGNVSTDSGEGWMAALGVRREPGPLSTVPPNGAADVAWEVGGVPVGVGMSATSGEDLVVTSFMATVEFTARLEGPGGYVLDGEMCGLCVTGGFSSTVESGSGDPGVLAGTYTVRVQSEAAAGARLQPFALYLQR